MTISTKIKIRRGPVADLKTIQLDDGELGITTDTKELYVGVAGINNPISILRKTIIPIDWNNKANALGYFKKISGTGTIGYDPNNSVMGVGSFTVTGNGTWVIESPLSPYDYFAVCPTFGIGGRIAVSGVASFAVGCEFYDNAGGYLPPTVSSQNWFIINAVGTGPFVMHEGYVKGESTIANTMPVNTRLARPIISVSGNLGTVKFDFFDIYHLESLAFYS